MTDIEIMGLIKKGLQPYSTQDYRQVTCPSKYHLFYILNIELDIIKETVHLTERFGSATDWYGKRRIAAIEIELNKIMEEDPYLMSWKYVILPKENENLKVLMREMSAHVFRRRDAYDFIKLTVSKHSIEAVARSSVRKRASAMWKFNKNISMTKMVKLQSVVEISKSYSQSNLINWMEDLCPRISRD